MKYKDFTRSHYDQIEKEILADFKKRKKKYGADNADKINGVFLIEPNCEFCHQYLDNWKKLGSLIHGWIYQFKCLKCKKYYTAVRFLANKETRKGLIELHDSDSIYVYLTS